MIQVDGLDHEVYDHGEVWVETLDQSPIDLMMVGVHDLKYHKVAPYIPETDPSIVMDSLRDPLWLTTVVVSDTRSESLITA